MFFSATRSISRVRTQLARMRELAARPDGELFAAAPCSGWSPSEHIDHSIRVCASIVLRILDAEAPRGERGLSAAGRIILLLGRIPRGRGKSPERVRGLRQTRDELHASLDKLEGKLALLAADHLEERRGPIVPHPRFGGLIPSQALRFAAIHNDHHLRIVDDILKTV
jgi:DinB superfamily